MFPHHPQTAEALHVLTHPQDYVRHPILFGDRFALLKEARGQRVHFENLPDPQHIVKPATPTAAAGPTDTVALIDAASARVRDKLRAARHRTLRTTLRGPDGGDAA